MKKLAKRRSYQFGALLLLMFLLSCASRIGLQPTHEAEVTMTAGENVRLLYEGPPDAKDIFCKDEIVTVFRPDRKEPSGYVEVGKIKIVGPHDRKNLKGVIVEGKIRSGDVVRKALVLCRVAPLLPGKE